MVLVYEPMVMVVAPPVVGKSDMPGGPSSPLRCWGGAGSFRVTDAFQHLSERRERAPMPAPVKDARSAPAVPVGDP